MINSFNSFLYFSHNGKCLSYTALNWVSWFFDTIWASSCTTTYSMHGWGFLANSRLKRSLWVRWLQLPHLVFISRILKPPLFKFIFSSKEEISLSQSERMVAMAVCSERECGYFKTTLPTISLFKFYTLLPAANEYTLYPGRWSQCLWSRWWHSSSRQGYRPAGLWCWLRDGYH